MNYWNFKSDSRFRYAESYILYEDGTVIFLRVI